MAQRRTYFREWRKYRGHTLEVAAELSGMSVASVSAIERGTQNPSNRALDALAKAYDCEPAQLLSLDPGRPLSADPRHCDIWSIWETASADERRKITEIARIIVGKP
jgi:transcriptional regulator with XRE-family HTH domain